MPSSSGAVLVDAFTSPLDIRGVRQELTAVSGQGRWWMSTETVAHLSVDLGSRGTVNIVTLPAMPLPQFQQKLKGSQIGTLGGALPQLRRRSSGPEDRARPVVSHLHEHRFARKWVTCVRARSGRGSRPRRGSPSVRRAAARPRLISVLAELYPLTLAELHPDLHAEDALAFPARSGGFVDPTKRSPHFSPSQGP